MDESRRITVPFEKKALARNLGAVFNRIDRNWYLPDDVSEETEAQLKNLSFEQSFESECSTYEDNSFAENVADNILQSVSESNIAEQSETLLALKNSLNETWENLIALKEPLEVALAIKNAGMPEDASLRTGLLKVLGLRRPGDYPISYDGMLACSESFAALYPTEYVTDLVLKVNFGRVPYQEAIRNSSLSEEEKALLLLFLPIEE